MRLRGNYIMKEKFKILLKTTFNVLLLELNMFKLLLLAINSNNIDYQII